MKNSSPSPDKIHQATFKNIHLNNFRYLFPSAWKTAIIPTMEIEFCSLNSDSYCPTALTSVLGDMFGKVMNKRLISFLECNYISLFLQTIWLSPRKKPHP